MSNTFEYHGKKYRVIEEDYSAEDEVTFTVVPVPELPDEPPVGTILVDDDGEAWQRVNDPGNSQVGWIPIGCNMIWTWRELLSRSDLRQVVVVGKATDSVVRFNAVSNNEREFDHFKTTDDAGVSCHWYEGHSDDEAPVHGYFAKVTG